MATLVQFYENAKINQTIPADVCDFMIATYSGDDETAEKLFQKWQAEDDWRTNTPHGRIVSFMERITGPGFDDCIRVPLGIEMAAAADLIDNLGSRQSLTLAVNQVDDRTFRVESLY